MSPENKGGFEGCKIYPQLPKLDVILTSWCFSSGEESIFLDMETLRSHCETLFHHALSG
jgi:hypothetical protein